MLYPNPQIYHSLRAIFVHVPKTAGMSIEERLRGIENGHVLGHTSAMDFRKSFPKEFAAYFKFAIVRDPLDRFISAYSFLKHGSPEKDPNVRIVQECGTMDRFARKITARPGILSNIVHMIPQHQFICDPQGGILVDSVFRYEDLENAWREICRRLGIRADPLPKVNASRRVSRDEVTDAVLFVVRQAYARDFELFGYAPP